MRSAKGPGWVMLANRRQKQAQDVVEKRTKHAEGKKPERNSTFFSVPISCAMFLIEVVLQVE